MRLSTSLLGLSSWTLVLMIDRADGHAIKRTSVSTSSDEPVFTIQTSMPSSTSTYTNPPKECFSNGSTFLCPTSTSTTTPSQSGDEDDGPVFCPAPTRIPEGLCYTTETYTFVPTQIPSSSASGNASQSSVSANATTTTTTRMYPCAEKTTTYSSRTYALNCVNAEGDYVTCPTSLPLTPIPFSTVVISDIPTITSTDTASSVAETNSNNSTTSSTTISLSRINSKSRKNANKNANIITQCFNQQGTPTICPLQCPDPFQTAPGPVVPTAVTLTTETTTGNAAVNDQATQSTSEKIFQTSPAPIITSFMSAPAFLTSGLSS